MTRVLRTGFALAGALALLVPGAYGHAGDVTIFPSMIETRVPPGGDFTTVIRVVYTKDDSLDTVPLRILIDTEDWDMDPNGRLSFTAEHVDERSVRPWVHYTPGEDEIVPGEEVYVRLSVVVPPDALPGEYRGALIAQPRAPYKPVKAGEKRLDLRLRLATVLYVEVPPIERGADLIGLEVRPNHENIWCVYPTFANVGTGHLRIYDSFTVTPNTLAPSDPVIEMPFAESGVVLPGRHRTIEIPMLGGLESGEYRLFYQADAGEDMPVIEGETIFYVPDGQAPLDVTTTATAAGVR